MEEKRTKLQVGSLLATGALFVIFLGVYLFQFTRPGAFIAGEFFPAQPAGDTVLYQGELHGVPGVLIFEPQEDGGVFLLQFGGFSEKYGFAFGEEEGPHGRPLTITGGDGALVLECFYAGPGLLSLTVAFPMAWFKLNHFLSVRDPEPSDFYLAMMKVEWVLVPVLLLIGYLWGLTLYT